MIWALDGIVPEIDPTAWVAPDANVIGKVRLGPGASVWFGATLRGDTEWIEVGAGSNVQEASVLHTDLGFPLVIGRGCTIGHKAMLHGCTIGDNALVGMGATVLNGAVIGSDSLVGACALVTEGKQMPPGMLIVGAPAQPKRALTAAQVEGLRNSARHYQANAARFLAGLSPVG
jgi:carbonic anhydrase/acetyltransferase-like protein (isoleucine patch superfamily)